MNPFKSSQDSTLSFGQIKVTIPSGAVRTWQCVADGVADNRATVFEAMYYAAVNMPDNELNSTSNGFAVRNAAPSRGVLVEFGAGDFGMSGGIDLRVAFRKMGLTVRGQGKFITRFRYNGLIAWTAAGQSSQYIMFKVVPSSVLDPLQTAVHPTVGDYHNYARDIHFSGMGFYDDNPGLHQTATVDGTATGTATSWNAGTFTMTDAEGTLTNARYSIAANPFSQLRNVTTGASGLIVSNTATTVTLDSNGLIGGLRAGVEDNTFALNDVYSIALHDGVEESHGIQIFYTLNATATDTFFDSIGDESICFEQCINSDMSYNQLFNTPSRGGGQALNCVSGDGVSISKNLCQGSMVRGTKSKVSGSSAIGLEILAGSLDDMKNVIISDNIIMDYDSAGIVCNNAKTGKVMSGVSITGNIIDDCGGGVLLDGNFVHEAFKISSNTITNCVKTGNGATDKTGTGIGIGIDLLAANNINCTIENNTVKTCGAVGIMAGGTDLLLSNNHVASTASHAIQLPANVRTLIRGGTIDSPGTSGTGKSIQATSYANGQNVEVDGVVCTRTVDATSTIQYCKTVDNCVVRATTNSIANMISDVTNASGNTLDGGIRPSASATGGRISRNKIKYIFAGTTNAEAIALASGNTGFRVHDNDIDVTNTAGTYRKAITLAAGADNNWIQNNKCVVSTAAVAITDAGSGNIFKGNSGNATSGTAATITAAATSVAVTHGVGYTPLPGDIVVTPTLLSSSQSFWVSNITSTQFTINVNVAPGAGTATFDWSVDNFRS